MATESREGTGVASSDPELPGFFEATYRRAYSLAFRITGEASTAEAATESAYRGLPRPFTEERLFDLVRQDALRAAPERSPSADDSQRTVAAVRAAFASLDQLERSALELVYSGGMTVAAIAAVLERDDASIRSALRAGLLRLGRVATEKGVAS